VRGPEHLVIDDGARDANHDVQRGDDAPHRLALDPHDELGRIRAMTRQESQADREDKPARPEHRARG
jgi:hypothetical protein